MNEVDILKACKHPNIIRMISYYEDAKLIHIVVEYLEGRDMFTFLDHRILDEKPIINLAK
jgi:serine/threonine protein kinase